MAFIRIDWNEPVGKIKPMHAVNNGVAKGRMCNFDDYGAAGFPYMRNHDASYCEEYGSEHCVDITAIFPDFDADPDDPASYDFTETDAYLGGTLETGTKLFYRLGQRIEHTIKKYNVHPPKDFHKWAVICEHIIRHYNEGWADGHHWNIEYWEIWNEPDVTPLCWTGTVEEFCDFFVKTIVHLKNCFPHLKIGGPALGGSYSMYFMKYLLGVLTSLDEPLPLDFFSWHLYTTDPHTAAKEAVLFRETLDSAGYTHTESILNEWNYIEGFFDEPFRRSVETIIGMKGAAFSAAFMCEGQNSPVDMLMYYDARPSFYNGLFDFYTLRPLKGYYAFTMFNDLYRMRMQVKSSSDDDEIYTVCAKDGDGNRAAYVVYFTNRPDAEEKTIGIEAEGTFDVYTLDEAHNKEKTGTVTLPGMIAMQPNTVVLLKNA